MKKGISLAVNQIIILIIAIIIGIVIIIYVAPKFSEGGKFLEGLKSFIDTLIP